MGPGPIPASIVSPVEYVSKYLLGLRTLRPGDVKRSTLAACDAAGCVCQPLYRAAGRGTGWTAQSQPVNRNDLGLLVRAGVQPTDDIDTIVKGLRLLQAQNAIQS